MLTPSALLAFFRVIPWSLVDSPHKEPVMQIWVFWLILARPCCWTTSRVVDDWKVITPMWRHCNETYLRSVKIWLVGWALLERHAITQRQKLILQHSPIAISWSSAPCLHHSRPVIFENYGRDLGVKHVIDCLRWRGYKIFIWIQVHSPPHFLERWVGWIL